MLAQRGWSNIEVWERKQPPPPPEAVVEWGDVARSYNIGLANRGQDVLADIGALDLVASWSADVNGRKDWVPDGPEEGRVTEAVHRDYIVRVLPRDRLSTCLLQHCLENHSDAVTVRFGVECTSVKWTGNTVQLGCKDGEQPETEVEADFLVGADGARSAVHHAMEAEDSGFSIRRLHERNTRVYRTLRLEIPEDWRGDLNYSVRTAAGHVMEMLPTRERVLLGVLLFRPGDETVEGIRTEAEARKYFKENFPQLYPHIADTEFAAFASRRVSMLPTFQYAGPVLHRGDNTVVLGDSIHTVKPYFGMGVNSALEDVGVLSSSIQEHGDDNLGSALEAYSDRRSRDAKALVELSHGFDGGLAQFVIPLIIDKFFNKLAPWLFKPPAIRMLQSSVFGSFHQVRMRKRLDRILQVLFVAIAATLAVLAVKALVTAAASVLL